MIRKPLVIIEGRVQELPASDSLAGGLAVGDEVVYSKRIDFVTDNLLYKGEAVIGSAESAPIWRIRKIVISLDGDVSETWAEGSASFDKAWTDRLTLNYS